MMRAPKRGAWLIGASRGMGLETGRILVERGWTVRLSARNRERLEAASRQIGAEAHAVDATDRNALLATAHRIFSENPPELVMLNAGDYRQMPLAEFDVALFERLNRVNYLAAVYVLDAVLPLMRDAGGGQILLNASAAGYRGLPTAGPYSAPKAAVIHLAETLAPELEAWHIRLRVINPGFVRSDLTAQNQFPMPFLIEPEDAARRIVDGIDGKGFEITFPKRFTYLLKVLRCLPYRLYLPLARRLIAKP